jgi:dihydropteroate synthase
MDLVTPRVMGILNITPDSFYDGGKHKTDKDILTHVEQMLSEGADIIDVGGYSSRPFADNISGKEEKSRLTYALKLIRKEFPAILISVDTFRSQIARYVVSEYGAGIINDISAGLIDDKMFAVIAELRVTYILMHMKGTPGNMQKNPVYTDVVKELLAFFSERIKTARDAGINDIIIDPGFGFGKTAGDNFRLLHELRLFEMLGYPVMAGLSRKSMVYRSLGVTPDDALNGTVILQTLALNNGAVLLRVHDVKQAVEAVKLIRLYKDSIV